MNPLAVEIWCSIAIGYVLVSLTIWVVARFSPIEWVSSKPPCSMACDHLLAQIKEAADEREQLELQHLRHHVGTPLRSDAAAVTTAFGESSDTESKASKSRRVKNDDTAIEAIRQQHHKQICSCSQQNSDDDEGNVNADNGNNDSGSEYNEECDDFLLEQPNVTEGTAAVPAASSGLMYDWDEICNHDHDHDNETELVTTQNDFTLKNSFWFAIGALMQQGSDLHPRVDIILI